VVATFCAAGEMHGWPAATLTDNGAVYTSRFTGGRNAFESLLAYLGIRRGPTHVPPAGSRRCSRRSPVLTLAVVQSGVAMLVGFGLAWSGEQVGLVVGFSAAVLGWIARSQVIPKSRVGA
jgi:hypothetical protein